MIIANLRRRCQSSTKCPESLFLGVLVGSLLHALRHPCSPRILLLSLVMIMTIQSSILPETRALLPKQGHSPATSASKPPVSTTTSEADHFPNAGVSVQLLFFPAPGYALYLAITVSLSFLPFGPVSQSFLHFMSLACKDCKLFIL